MKISTKVYFPHKITVLDQFLYRCKFLLQAHIFFYHRSFFSVWILKKIWGFVPQSQLFRTILPIIVMSFTYIRLLCLINKDSVNKNIPTQENQHQKLTTLLAVVSFFILFNLPGVILIIWELAVFSRIQTCQSFDENTGYSTWNYIVTDLGGKNLAKLSFLISQRIIFISSFSVAGLQQCDQLYALRGICSQVQTHHQKDCWKVFLSTEKREKRYRSHHFYFKNYRLIMNQMVKIRIYHNDLWKSFNLR